MSDPYLYKKHKRKKCKRVKKDKSIKNDQKIDSFSRQAMNMKF